MDAAYTLQIHVAEHDRHRGELMYEWILEHARSLGIPGGTALRSIAGYGRQQGAQQQHGLMDLTPNLPIVLQFLCSAQQIDNLVSLLASEQLNLFYTRTSTRIGWTHPTTLQSMG
ncbi:MAG: DUF190 domain-containing protein [Propionibacteriaceae bacterium]|nr:DUF190 domain-containing protein [Propionibacteriaceae bacterium]